MQILGCLNSERVSEIQIVEWVFGDLFYFIFRNRNIVLDVVPFLFPCLSFGLGNFGKVMGFINCLFSFGLLPSWAMFLIWVFAHLFMNH